MEDILSACMGMEVASYAPGAPLIRQGARDGCFFILRSGEVSVTKSGTEIARIDQPGAVFGEISALLDLPYSADVTATTEVTAHVTGNGADFIADNPAIALHTARILAQRLYLATAYLADLKEQFSDHADHFGVMDRILDTLLQKQGVSPLAEPHPHQDPRL